MPHQFGLRSLAAPWAWITMIHLMLSGCACIGAFVDHEAMAILASFLQLPGFAVLELLRGAGWRSPWFLVAAVVGNAALYGLIGSLAYRVFVPPPRNMPRGLCEQCGYDLRGTRAAGRRECPECGATFGQP